jgi:hypothetical protein
MISYFTDAFSLKEANAGTIVATSENSEERSVTLKEARNELRKEGDIAKKIEDRGAEIDVLTCLALNYSEVSHLKPAETFQVDIKRHFDLAEKFQKEVIAYKTAQHDDSYIEKINAVLGLSKIHFRRGRNLLELLNSIQELSNTTDDWIKKAQKDFKRAKKRKSSS